MHNPIATRFSDAAHRYEGLAHVQKQAAIEFDLWLASLGLRAPDSIAEIGCGTGFFTRLLHQRYQSAALCITDVAPEMIEVCKAKFAPSDMLRFEVRDGRSHSFETAPDWVLSTMCFQWFTPLKPVLKHHLAQSRLLAFSIMLDGSFAQWQAAHERLGISSGLRPLPSFDAVFDSCHTLGANKLHSHRISLAEAHPNGLSFASSLRAIGADQPKENHQPVNLRAVCRQLEHGFSANYEIGFFCIER